MSTLLQECVAKRSLESKSTISIHRVTKDSPWDQQVKVVDYKRQLDEYQSTFDLQLKSNQQPPLDQHTKDYFENSTENEWSWLIVKDGVPVGYFHFTMLINNPDTDVKVNDLHSVFIEPDYRGQGIFVEAFKQAIDLLEDVYKDQIDPLYVYFFSANKHAHRLYRKVGFKPHSECLVRYS